MKPMKNRRERRRAAQRIILGSDGLGAALARREAAREPEFTNSK
jgi:hypothetical protein